MKMTVSNQLNTVAVLALTVLPGFASAHHPMDGETPSTLWQGLLSGLGHPVLGLDHLAFIVSIGLLSALVKLRSPILPMALVAATLMGTGLVWSNVTPPFIELVVALSVLTSGCFLFRTPSRLKMLIPPAALAATYHGIAYGEAIIGAEPTPLGAYLVGLSMIQMTITGLVFIVSRLAIENTPTGFRFARYLGASSVSAIGLIALSTALSA